MRSWKVQAGKLFGKIALVILVCFFVFLLIKSGASPTGLEFLVFLCFVAVVTLLALNVFVVRFLIRIIEAE